LREAKLDEAKKGQKVFKRAGNRHYMKKIEKIS